MMTRALLFLSMAALTGLTGCKRSAPPSSAPTVSESRVLAMAPPGGTARADVEIAKQQQAIEKNPAKVETWIALGHAWIQKARSSGDPGFYLNASASTDLALELSPGLAPALNLKALALLNDHRFQEAKRMATSILSSHPADAVALGTLSDADLELGDLTGAMDAAQRMMDLKPNLPSYSRAAYLRWLQGDAATAKRYVRFAIDSGWNPRDVEPLAWVVVQAAMIFWQEGDVPGADAGFDQALALVPDYPPALVGKARVALALEEPKRAAGLLQRADGTTPLVETKWLLADAFEAMGDLRRAETTRKALVRDGRQRDRLTLALYFATKNQASTEALQLLDEERKVRGGLYVEDAYAWALYRAGRYTEARSASDRALALGTQDARLLFHAGAIRIAQGDREAGLARVKDALALNAAFDWTGAAEGRRMISPGAGAPLAAGR